MAERDVSLGVRPGNPELTGHVVRHRPGPHDAPHQALLRLPGSFRGVAGTRPQAHGADSLLRETALIYVSEPEFNAALRKAADYFFGMLLECHGDWPAWSESSTRTEMRAAVADTRHLQGFLASVGQERNLSSLSKADAKLSRHGHRSCAGREPPASAPTVGQRSDLDYSAADASQIL